MFDWCISEWTWEGGSRLGRGLECGQSHIGDNCFFPALHIHTPLPYFAYPHRPLPPTSLASVRIGTLESEAHFRHPNSRMHNREEKLNITIMGQTYIHELG